MRRTRLVAAVLTILLVTVAAIAEHLSEVSSSYELVRTPLEQATAYESGQVRVSDVRVATEVPPGRGALPDPGPLRRRERRRAGDRPRRRDGREQPAAGGGRPHLLPHVQREHHGRPGLRDRPRRRLRGRPTHIDDLTLELWDQGLTYRYYQRTRTPLGITAANAHAWPEAGTGRSVVAVRRRDDGPVVSGPVAPPLPAPPRR